MKILVIRLSSIGDVILATPVIAALRLKYPHAVVDFLVMDRFKAAISGNPHIDKVITFEKERYRGVPGIFRFSRTLCKPRYDLVIDLHAKIRSILLTKFMGAQTLRYRKRRWWKTLLVNLRLIRYRVDDTIVRSYWRPLQTLGIPCPAEKLDFTFTKEDSAAIAAHRDTVVLAPGAANATKRWPADYFAQLGALLKVPVTLIGGPQEFAELEGIRSKIGAACCNLAGKLTLKQSGALIAQSRYLITNDSGPFHMARGVGAKAFVIFGPTDPGMFTYDQNAVLIYNHEPCSPCSLHGDKKCPRGHFRCMLGLTPEYVAQRIQSQMKRMC